MPKLPKANFGTLDEVLEHKAEGSNPLPQVHSGGVYQYTTIAGAHGIIKSNTLWASHSLCLNDPTEREYGWNLIRETFKKNEPAGQSGYAYSQIEHILKNPEGWYPESYVASASLDSDSLTQFRLYGPVELALHGGQWETVSRDRVRDDQAPVIGGYPQLPVGKGEWRKVCYDTDEAIDLCQEMLATVAAYIDSHTAPRYKGYNPLAAFMALEYLALHIKNPDFRVENEVRLVITENATPDTVEVREINGKLIPYVEARPVPKFQEVPEDIVQKILLGPGSGEFARNKNALIAHMARNTRSLADTYNPVSINQSLKQLRG